jgi:hypothetical protein
MRDWKAMAAASGAGIPADDVERVTKPLVGLEQTFRPLANSLTFDEEPATAFDAAEDAE